MKTYKGFDKDLKCRGFQFEIGGEYEEKEAIACKAGFHACEYPLAVFLYYEPNESRYCEVEQSGDMSKKNSDTKVASTKIKIGAELSVVDLIKASFSYTKERCTNQEQCGDWSALQGGYMSALQGGNMSALQGGDWSALQGGNWSALQGGNWSVMRAGTESKFKGGLWSVFAIEVIDDDYNIIDLKVAVVDGKKIKENTWYKLENGEFVEAE